LFSSIQCKLPLNFVSHFWGALHNDSSSMFASHAGEVFHFEGEQPSTRVMNAVTGAVPSAKGTVDDQPAYVAVIYIVSLRQGCLT
jgi:hypothetical protein